MLTELAKQGEFYLPVGVSARHVHLSEGDIARLFGPGHKLSPIRALTQPGQFASAEQVTIVGPKGEIGKVRVLGPARAETQVEITLTDALKLGVKDAPIRMSGKLEGTPGIKLVGPAGEVTLDRGVIVAARHIHMSMAQATVYGVHDGMIVSVRLGGARSCVLENVACRVGNGHELELHLDTDEANACGVGNGDYAMLILPGGCCKGACRNCAGNCGGRKTPSAGTGGNRMETTRRELLELVTESDINNACRDGRKQVFCARTALVTPSAADRASEKGIEIVRAAPAYTPAPARPEAEREVLDLVTEADLNVAYRANRTEIYCTKRAAITDAARDRLLETGIKVIRV